MSTTYRVVPQSERRRSLRLLRFPEPNRPDAPDPDGPEHDVLTRTSDRAEGGARYVWAATRLGLGSMFVWAFLDKTFGFGYPTPRADAWIHGGLTGSAAADWLLAIGAGVAGICLSAGILMRIAGALGVMLLLAIWARNLPSPTTPLLGYHLIQVLVLVGLVLGGTGDTMGLGRIWGRLRLVRAWPILK